MTSNPLPGFEPDLKSIIRERNNALAAAAAGKFAAAVQPIYGATDRGEPDHIGSAVLLDVHGTKVLITAAHVIDNNFVTSLYVGGGAELELIEAEFSITVAPSTIRRLDRHDIAFCELPSHLIEKLGGTYIGLNDVASHPPYEGGRLYTALGYPNSMNKVGWSTRKAKKIRPEMLQYGDVSPNRRKFRQAGCGSAGRPVSGNFPVFDGWRARSGGLEPAWMPVAAF
jgi:hypothetical protein